MGIRVAANSVCDTSVAGVLEPVQSSHLIVDIMTQLTPQRRPGRRSAFTAWLRRHWSFCSAQTRGLFCAWSPEGSGHTAGPRLSRVSRPTGEAATPVSAFSMVPPALGHGRCRGALTQARVRGSRVEEEGPGKRGHRTPRQRGRLLERACSQSSHSPRVP